MSAATNNELNPESESMEQVASRYLGHDVLCLSVMAQPLVDEMQRVIRWQAEQVEKQCEAIRYVLERLRRERGLRDLIGAGTESFERLTEQLANGARQDVDSIRDYYLPGSARLHRKRKEADD